MATDNSNVRGNYAGCLVRLVGHDFMDYRTNSSNVGGSDGCLNFQDGDNLGLKECIQNFSLNSVYSEHCTKVSMADFFVIAGESVMGRTATDYNSGDKYNTNYLLGKYMNNFSYGRTTVSTCSWNTGLMPNPTNGCPGLEDVFIDHVYKDRSNAWTLTAAISGAHTLGSARISTSGFNGFWSDTTNQGKFNNDYYKSIILKGW